jgi:uncharacterized protein (TIGR02246 family)
MRLCTTTLSVSLVCLITTASYAEDSVVDSAEKMIREWADALNRNDAAQLLEFYNESEQTEVVVSGGVHYQGYKAIRRINKETFENVRFYDSAATIVKTRRFGDTATATFEHRFRIQVADDDSRWQVHVRTTAVLHRFDGQWKIVVEHSSPIRGVERMTRIED